MATCDKREPQPKPKEQTLAEAEEEKMATATQKNDSLNKGQTPNSGKADKPTARAKHKQKKKNEPKMQGGHNLR